jgi:hypothetical protein
LKKTSMSERAENPPERLQPGSWTEAEVDALEGRRARNARGDEGTITAAAGLAGQDGAVFQYAVKLQWDHGQTIIGSKGDFHNGAFELLPG